MNHHSQNCKIPDEERCTALLKDSYQRQTKDRCHHFATIEMDGHQMCSKHACGYALQKALDSGKAKRLPYKTVGGPSIVFGD